MFKRLAVGRYLKLLVNSPDEVERIEAAKALSLLRARFVRRKLRRLLAHPDAEVRKWAAYALGFVGEKVDAVALSAIFADRSEAIDVRAHAGEALGHIGAATAETRDVLIEGLSDPSPEVRFWGAFAVGNYGDAAAIPKLQELVETDKDTVPGWWSLKKEAADAIEHIRQFPQGT